MPLFARWEYEGGLWGIWKVDESAEALEALCADKSLFADDLEAVKAPKRRLEILGVRVLLKTLLGEERRILHAPSGRPFLEGDSRLVTVSHTQGYVAVGLHSHFVPGIDIEQVRERVRKVAPRFVRADELPVTACLSDREYLLQLLLHWSAKETLYKVLGKEGVDFLEHLHVHPFLLQSEGEFLAESLFPGMPVSCRVRYLVHPDFVCTYCVRKA